MTRRHYLVLRNRHRLLLGEMTPGDRKLFNRYRDKPFMVRLPQDSESNWTHVVYCGGARTLLYRINSSCRPAGITETDDIRDNA